MWRLLLLVFSMVGFLGVTGCVSSSMPKNVDPHTLNIDGTHDNKGMSYFPVTRPATGNKVFIFDPNYHAWAIYDAEGHRVDTGNASGGKAYCPDLDAPCETIVGTFKVIKKGDASCISHTFPLKTHGGAPTPYCMYFSDQGYAIHGSYELPADDNESHGCIRVNPVAAKWLSQNFMTLGTTVIVLPYNN